MKDGKQPRKVNRGAMSKLAMRNAIRRSIAYSLDMGECPEKLIMEDGSQISICELSDADTKVLSQVSTSELERCAKRVAPNDR